MKLEFKQLIDINDDILNTITTWMYDWWGERDGYSFEETRCFMQHSINKDKLPQTYGLFINEEIIGMYQLVHEDLSIRPDIYPCLANVYIDENYRKRGYGKKLLENVKRTAKENLNFDEIFLYTKHIGLYEKFDWVFVSDFDTYTKNPRIQKLYKLDLK